MIKGAEEHNDFKIESYIRTIISHKQQGSE